jgi:hypothetical protein
MTILELITAVRAMELFIDQVGHMLPLGTQVCGSEPHRKIKVLHAEEGRDDRQRPL